jgi:hypothetical protein
MVFRQFLLHAVLIIALTTTTNLFAQPGAGCGSPGNPCDPGPPPVPITGIEILLGAGALLGAKKFVDRRKKKEAGSQ